MHQRPAGGRNVSWFVNVTPFRCPPPGVTYAQLISACAENCEPSQGPAGRKTREKGQKPCTSRCSVREIFIFQSARRYGGIETERSVRRKRAARGKRTESEESAERDSAGIARPRAPPGNAPFAAFVVTCPRGRARRTAPRTPVGTPEDTTQERSGALVTKTRQGGANESKQTSARATGKHLTAAAPAAGGWDIATPPCPAPLSPRGGRTARTAGRARGGASGAREDTQVRRGDGRGGDNCDFLVDALVNFSSNFHHLRKKLINIP